MWGAIPGRVGLDCLRKSPSKPVSSIPPGSLLQSLPPESAFPRCWAVTCKLDKAFPPLVTLGQCFYPSNREVHYYLCEDQPK